MEISEFLSPTPQRTRQTRWIFWTLVILFLALYCLTLKRAAHPGESAQWITWVTGLDIRAIPPHPLLSSVSGWLAGKGGALVLRLNLFAALAGALCVGWTYTLTSFLLYEWMNNDEASTLAPTLAPLGGIVTATIAGLSLPLWMASTQFRPEIFEAAGLLLSLHLLTVYASRQKLYFLLLSALCFGAGMIDSYRLVLFIPLYFLLLLITTRMSGEQPLKKLAYSIMALIVAYVGGYLLLFLLFSLKMGMDFTFPSLLTFVVHGWREQFEALRLSYSVRFWFISAAMGFLPLLLTVLTSRILLYKSHSLSLPLLEFILTLVSLSCLFDLPFTPQTLWFAQGKIPILSAISTAFSLGLCLSGWFFLLRSGAVPAEPSLPPPPDAPSAETEVPPTAGRRERVVSFISRLFSLFFLFIGLIGVGISIFLSARQISGLRPEYADRMADEVLEAMKNRRWIITNNILDPHLLIRAHVRNIPIRLLQPYRGRDRDYLGRVKGWIEEEPSFSNSQKRRYHTFLSYSFHLFIEDLFSTDKALNLKLTTMGIPDLWYSAEWEPLPELPIFSGTKKLKSASPLPLYEKALAFEKKWMPFFDRKESHRGDPLAYPTFLAMRRYCAFTMNNLGVALDDLGEGEKAWTCYKITQAIYPGHISALLNQFEMISRGLHPEAKERVAEQLKEKINDPKERYSLWALSRYFGYVRNYELFVKMGWNWALSSTPSTILAGLRSSASHWQAQKTPYYQMVLASLYAMRGSYQKSEEIYLKALDENPQNTMAISGLVRLALNQDRIVEARQILQTRSKGLKPFQKSALDLDWAALHIAMGELDKARIILQRIFDEASAERRPAPAATTLLAIVMIEQGQEDEVASRILPILQNMSGNSTAHLPFMIRGLINQRKGVSGFEAARQDFIRALQIRPDAHALQSAILRLDAGLHDARSAEIRAMVILRRNPDDAYANYVLGSLHFSESAYSRAEPFLRKAAAAPYPTLGALNNYALLLCRLERYGEAEKMARKAVKSHPNRYEPLSTLATIQAHAGKSDEAEETLKKTRKIRWDDPRLYLIDAVIAMNRGEFNKAEEALLEAGDLSMLSAEDDHYAKELEKMLKKKRESL